MTSKILTSLCALWVLAGCASTPTPTAEPTKPPVEKSVRDQTATASGGELQVNPNGKVAQPGEKLGSK